MFDIDKWREVVGTITRNKTRSVLTAFGVFWGLLMFILLVGFGNGFRKGIMDQFDGFATNTAFFYTNRTGEPYNGLRKGRWWDMNSRDIESIRRKVPSAEYIAPMLFLSGDVVRGNKRGSYQAMGIPPDYFNIQKMTLLYGRLLNDIDMKEWRKVCLIGKEVYETLFDEGENPLGETIRVGSIYYRIIGVCEPQSTIFIGTNPYRSIYIPFATVLRTTSRGDRFYQLCCTAQSGMRASVMQEEVIRILKENHDIAPQDKKAVGSFNLEEQTRKVQGVFSGINILVWIIGLGALFSGIVGISNIMLVTVRERTREIGVRRAIGAKPLAIITQILSESLVLTVAAGIVGFLLGVLILTLLQTILAANAKSGGFPIVPFLSFRAALAAMGILIFSGVIAGLMPALKALRIKAIDALRDE